MNEYDFEAVVIEGEFFSPSFKSAVLNSFFFK
jgi:hypothetical protein